MQNHFSCTKSQPANPSNANAVFLLANELRRQGGRSNYIEAINLYQQTIEMVDVDAMNYRASRDVYRYERALSLKSDAMYHLALLHMEIRYKHGVKRNNISAMYHLAILNLEIRKENYHYAMHLLSYASIHGHVDAMNKLASCYLNPDNIAMLNYQLSIELYERAIKLGSAEAMLKRAQIYMYYDYLKGRLDYARAIALTECAHHLNPTHEVQNLLESIYDHLDTGSYFADHERNYKTEILKSKVANKVFSLLWDPIITHQLKPSQMTIDLISRYAEKNFFIQKTKISKVLDSTLLNACCEIDHPIARVLNHQSVADYAALCTITKKKLTYFIELLIKERFPPDVILIILSFYSPGPYRPDPTPFIPNKELCQNLFKLRVPRQSSLDIAKPEQRSMLQWLIHYPHGLSLGLCILVVAAMTKSCNATLNIKTGIAVGMMMTAGCLFFAYQDKIAAHVSPINRPALRS